MAKMGCVWPVTGQFFGQTDRSNSPRSKGRWSSVSVATRTYLKHTATPQLKVSTPFVRQAFDEFLGKNEAMSRWPIVGPIRTQHLRQTTRSVEMVDLSPSQLKEVRDCPKVTEDAAPRTNRSELPARQR